MSTALYADHLRTVLARYEAALARAGFDQAVVHSGIPKVAFQDDYHYAFKPNPNFLQLLPLDRHPGCFVSIAVGKKPQLIFLQPFDYWHVVPEDPSGDWVSHFDIKIIRTPDEARAALNLTPKTAFIGEDSARFEDWGFAAFNPQTLLAPLHWQRGLKTAWEVENIAYANRVAARAHNAARDAFLAGESELGIHYAYLRASGLKESELPYGNIVALNEHGAVLHYTELQTAKPAQSRSFLIDAGANRFGYASDITRTYARDKNEFSELIAALDVHQLKLIDAVRPGQSYVDLHIAFHRAIGGLLKQFDVITIDGDSAVKQGITSTFFPHGIGHLLGIQVHDIAGRVADDTGTPNPPPAAHPYLRLTRKIEKDMVFTVEPGIYFIDMLLNELKAKPQAAHVNWAKVEAFKPFGGVRIEDNVLVTDGTPRNLTREAFAAV